MAQIPPAHIPSEAIAQLLEKIPLSEGAIATTIHVDEDTLSEWKSQGVTGPAAIGLQLVGEQLIGDEDEINARRYISKPDRPKPEHLTGGVVSPNRPVRISQHDIVTAVQTIQQQTGLDDFEVAELLGTDIGQYSEWKSLGNAEGADAAGLMLLSQRLGGGTTL